MASYLTIYATEPERLWPAVLETARGMNADVSGTPPDFAISLEHGRLFFFPADEAFVLRYRGAAAEDLLAAAIGALDVIVEDDDERRMTGAEFAARTRAWRRRRARWAPHAVDRDHALVPLLAHLDGRVEATVHELAWDREWVIAPPRLVDEVDADGWRTVGLVLWLCRPFHPRRRRRPPRIDPALDDALLDDARYFITGLERVAAATGVELELEFGGERVGQIDRDGATGALLATWPHQRIARP